MFIYICAPSLSSQRDLSREKFNRKCVSDSQSSRSRDADASRSTIVAMCWPLKQRVCKLSLKVSEWIVVGYKKQVIKMDELKEKKGIYSKQKQPSTPPFNHYDT